MRYFGYKQLGRTLIVSILTLSSLSIAVYHVDVLAAGGGGGNGGGGGGNGGGNSGGNGGGNSGGNGGDKGGSANDSKAGRASDKGKNHGAKNKTGSYEKWLSDLLKE